MSLETKRHLANINDSLRAEHANLKTTKDHLLDHIGGLVKREKQLHKMKQDLIDQLIATQEQLKVEQKTKEPLCLFLKEQLSMLDKKHIEGNIKLKNLENQYQNCLLDYERVIEVVTNLVEGAAGTEAQLSRLKESDITMKAMIFDCERLKRVLEEEKRYFKQLCQSQEKNHGERLKELQSIRKNITKEEDSSTCSIRLTKLHIGLMKLGNYFDRKISQHRDDFLRPEARQVKVVKLGIKSLETCLRIGSTKMLENKRSMFRTWHNKVFPKSVLKDITERALNSNEESRLKIKMLNIMEEKVLQKNTQLLHLYEKFKFLETVANKFYRKDMHYGFNIWRQQVRGVKKIANIMESAFSRAIPQHLKRVYFGRWLKTANVLKRVEIAGMLLSEFESTRQMARGFRRWRLQLLNIEEKKVRFYMRRLKDQQTITKRLNYQKRKTKIMTALELKLTKTTLRNYFGKYWHNVKQMRVKQKVEVIEKQREVFSQQRKSMLKAKANYAAKDKNLLLYIFRDFVYKAKIVPVYKGWKNEAQCFKRQKRALLSLVLRREAKNKIYVMNEFRKCVQYYQKKEMHQVLTDLNHKMEAINQKSTQFREALKACIDNLGLIASKKLDTVTSYVYTYQKRLLYNTYNAKTIKKAYKLFLLQRMTTIFNLFGTKRAVGNIREYIKTNQKEIQSMRKAVKHHQNKIKLRHRNIFQWLHRQARGHHQGFARLIHVENVFYFYRLTYAFAAIRRTYTAEKYTAMHKYLQQQGNVLNQNQENLANTINTRQNCQKDMLQFFGKFVTYEERHRQIKMRQKTHDLLSQYLTKFRNNVHTLDSKERAAGNIGSVFMNNTQMLFFRNLMIIRYEQLMQTLKEELAKINKKRKGFEEKNEKIVADMLKKHAEELRVYNECKEYFQFYSKRYEGLLDYYQKRTVSNEATYFKERVFLEWKYEYFSSKRLIKAIEVVYRRKLLKEPCQVVMNELRGRINKATAQEMIALMFERKGNKLKLDALSLWKVNIKKWKEDEIQKRLDNLDAYEDEMREELKDRAVLISNEVPRVAFKKLVSSVFMGFKKNWLEAVTNKRKVAPMLQRRDEALKREAMVHWKWLIHYKRTKRAYISFKSRKYAHELKRDVFNSMKHYRWSIYNIADKMRIIINNQMFKNNHFAFAKIRNEGANQRDELNYERRRALFSILKGKVGKLERIKQKVVHKWRALLIEKEHYLPTMIKRMELNKLKSAFANINEKKYWNEIYIKDIAEAVTQDGYNQVNQVTNSLMREGYDPDQIKDYLKKRNDKDLVILDGVIKHFRMWANKEVAVRAFHSWKQFVVLKKNIKKALSRVFNIAGGIGKYWSRWRSKDVHFNEILKKESRGNMLNRFRELSRLLKQYHRDIRDNTANLEELREINREYGEKNKVAVMMSLNVFSNSLKKGMFQGFNIWRKAIHRQRVAAMDERYEQMISGLEMLNEQKGKLRYSIGVMREENKQLKEKCMWGVECGKILERLLTEKDSLSVDLADKEHNMKLLLEDNLRLKQKMKLAKEHAGRLIRKVEEQRNEQQ